MHQAAYDWIARHATTDPVAVLDIGGRDINGTPRALFPAADPYRVLDLRPGSGVDIVADAAAWIPDREYDVIVCAEVFEHTPAWSGICATAVKACRPGGRLIVTCAGPGRQPHSAEDGGPVRPGEHYANVSAEQLALTLAYCGWRDVDVEDLGVDTRAVAYR